MTEVLSTLNEPLSLPRWQRFGGQRVPESLGLSQHRVLRFCSVGAISHPQSPQAALGEPSEAHRGSRDRKRRMTSTSRGSATTLTADVQGIGYFSLPAELKSVHASGMHLLSTQQLALRGQMKGFH